MSNARPKVSAAKVRYIKLGRGGGWEKESIENGIVRLGYSTESLLAPIGQRDWKAVSKHFISHGSASGKGTEYANVVKSFVEDDGTTLWITFYSRRLWWTKLDPIKPLVVHPDGHGTFRPCQGWSDSDTAGQKLHMEGISGAVTQLASYRGTCCDVGPSDYVLRRINGQRLPAVQNAERLVQELQDRIVDMVRLLTPKDLELLVDLIFSQSGWRRQANVGATEKIVELVVELPTTGERAFVQVKSSTNQMAFDEYLKHFEEGDFGRMFYVYHSGTVQCDDENVTLVDAGKLSEMIVDAGLTNWLIRRVS